MSRKITDFIETIPEKKDKRKKISLYKAIKIYCPSTVYNINKKLNGKKFNLSLKNNKNWYIVVINYLTKSNILETEKTDLGTFHNVTEEYIKYFNIPKSTVFSQTNFMQHLILYKDTIEEFLQQSGLLNKNGKEFYEEEKKEIKVNDKIKPYLKILSYILLFWSLLQFGMLVTKYGYNDFLPMLLNSIIFTISVLLISENK